MNLTRRLILISWTLSSVNQTTLILSLFFPHSPIMFHSLYLSLSALFAWFYKVNFITLQLAVFCFMFSMFDCCLSKYLLIFVISTRNRQICCFWHWTSQIRRANTTQQIGASNPFAGISSSSCKQTNPAQQKIFGKKREAGNMRL